MYIVFQVEKWWEDHAYLTSRIPLLPYCMMAQAMIIASVGIDESKEYRLKALSRCMYHSAEFWKLMRDERLRPPTNPDGSITFSANLYRHLTNSARIPCEDRDVLKTYFKTGKLKLLLIKFNTILLIQFIASEGDCPSHAIVIGKGRIFIMQTINEDGSICTPQQLLCGLKFISDSLDNDEPCLGIPILTCDNRDTWAMVKTIFYLLSMIVI